MAIDNAEGLALSALQAARFGLTLVVSERVFGGDIVTSAETWTVEAGNQEQLAAALDDVASNATEAHRRASAAKATVDALSNHASASAVLDTAGSAGLIP